MLSMNDYRIRDFMVILADAKCISPLFVLTKNHITISIWQIAAAGARMTNGEYVSVV